MYPQFEDEVKLEHLQGYLYVQQLIEGVAMANAGSIRQYSFDEIIENDKLNAKNLKELAISIFSKGGGYLSLNMDIRDQLSLEECLNFDWIDDWRTTLENCLYPWFADKYLSAKPIYDFYVAHAAKQKRWSKKEREEYLEKGKSEEKRVQKRFQEWNSCTKYFIDLLNRFFGLRDVKILKVNINRSKYANHTFFREMNFTWGERFDIFIFAVEDRRFILHLGNVLT